MTNVTDLALDFALEGFDPDWLTEGVGPLEPWDLEEVADALQFEWSRLGGGAGRDPFADRPLAPVVPLFPLTETEQIDDLRRQQIDAERVRVPLETLEDVTQAILDILNLCSRPIGCRREKVPILVYNGEEIDPLDDPEITADETVPVLSDVGTEIEVPDVGVPVFIPGSDPDEDVGSGPPQSDLPDPGPIDEGVEDVAIWEDIGGWVKDRWEGTWDNDPRTPGIIPWDPILGGGGGTVPPPTFAPPTSTIPTPTNGAPTVSTTCVTRRDQEIAARTGCSAAQVAQVRAMSRHRRRRRRMLTKSDVADISTMKSLLGNGEAFKTWLASQRLSR